MVLLEPASFLAVTVLLLAVFGSNTSSLAIYGRILRRKLKALFVLIVQNCNTELDRVRYESHEVEDHDLQIVFMFSRISMACQGLHPWQHLMHTKAFGKTCCLAALAGLGFYNFISDPFNIYVPVSDKSTEIAYSTSGPNYFHLDHD